MIEVTKFTKLFIFINTNNNLMCITANEYD